MRDADFLNVTNSFFSGLTAVLGVGSLTAGQVDNDGFLMAGGGAVGASINLGTSQAATANGVQITGATFTSLAVIGGAGQDVVFLAGLTVNGAFDGQHLRRK